MPGGRTPQPSGAQPSKLGRYRERRSPARHRGRERVMNISQTLPCRGSGAYGPKAGDYFAGARYDYVAELPRNPSARILEVGCSNGGTGALALSQGRCGTYVGIELFERAAAQAK